MKKTIIKKISIKQSVIAQHYQRFESNHSQFYRKILIAVVIGLAFGFLIHLMFGIIGIIISITIIGVWLNKLKNIQKSLKALNEWQVPQQHLHQLKLSFPELSTQQQDWIVEGFKDYLAMHVWREQHLAMPSYAVDQLWHSLLTDPVGYRALCLKILGRELKHIEYDENNDVPVKARQDAYFQAWCMSCKVNALEARSTSVLPRLFAVDYVLGLKQNPENDLEMNLADLKQYIADNNKSSCGGGSSCSSCGGD